MTSKRLSRLIAAAILAGTILSSMATFDVAPGLAQTEASTWAEPVLISEPRQSSWFPDILTDPTGRVHVVYSSQLVTQQGGYDQVVYTQSDDGVTWTRPNDIAALALGPYGESEVTRPYLFLDGDNFLHLSYKGLTTTSIFYSHAPLAGAGFARFWTPRQEVGDGGYFSEIVVDRRGTVHIVYTSNVVSQRCHICLHIFYRQSVDQGKTWTKAVDVSQVNTGAAKPQFMIDADDGLHLAWESAPGGTLGSVETPAHILYTSSFDYGTTWREPVLLQIPDSVGSVRVAMALDPKGRLIIVSTAMPSNEIFYTLSADRGQTWSLAAPVAGLKGSPVSDLDNLSLATDGSGRVHMVCNCSLEIREDLYNLSHVTWDGTAWSEPDIIHQYRGDFPEWPVVSIGLGNVVNVAWFVRNAGALFDTERGIYTIWYSRRVVDALSATPIPQPTLPPSATAPPISLVVQPTPRPTATQVLISGVVDPSRPYNEQDYIVLVVIAILPVLLIVTGIIIYQRVIRR